MSCAHLEQGRVRAPSGEGSAPLGRRGAARGRGLVNSASSASRSWDERRLLPRRRLSAQPGRPAAPAAAPQGWRADLRASGSEQGCTTPSAAAPRALTPLPVSGLSETRAVTRPESDGAAGPIMHRSGPRGGGAEAGSLREAQPRGGPAGGGEVAGLRGARLARAAAGRPCGTALEARGAREGVGARGQGGHPARSSGPGRRGSLGSNVRGGVRTDARPSCLAPGPAPRATRGPLRRVPGSVGLAKNRPTLGCSERVFSPVPSFYPRRGIPGCPVAVNPKVPR